MTSAALLEPATAPVVGTSVAGEIQGVCAAIAALDLTEVPGDRCAEALRGVDRAIRMLEAKRLAVLAAAERADVARRNGHSGTAAWAATTTHTRRDETAAQTKLASALSSGLDQTREALGSGDVSSDHAKVIAATAARLPQELTSDERARIESRLVESAKHLDPSRLRDAARRALKHAQRSVEDVDAHEHEVVKQEERAALAATRLAMRDNMDGTSSGWFTVPTTAAHILRNLVQQIASPRRDQATDARHGSVDGSFDGSTRYADTDWGHKYGLAFVEVLEHLPSTGLHGKVAATVVVNIDYDTLREGVGVAQLDTGHTVTAGEVRRLACQAGVVPLVLGGASQPLDLGQSRRFFSEAQRTALASRYDACAVDHCDRPYSWCELHHERPWSRGGKTDLSMAVPLCGFHHRRIHDPSYLSDISTTVSGIKTVRLRQR